MDQPQAIVGLLRRPDGTLVVLTSSKDGRQGKAIVCPNRDGVALWNAIEDVLGRPDAPPLASAPGAGDKKHAPAEDRGYVTDEKLRDSYKTLFSEVERQAKNTWGAPVVDAAATVLADASKRAQAALGKLSRQGGSKLYELRKKRKTG